MSNNKYGDWIKDFEQHQREERYGKIEGIDRLGGNGVIESNIHKIQARIKEQDKIALGAMIDRYYGVAYHLIPEIYRDKVGVKVGCLPDITLIYTATISKAEAMGQLLRNPVYNLEDILSMTSDVHTHTLRFIIPASWPTLKNGPDTSMTSLRVIYAIKQTITPKLLYWLMEIFPTQYHEEDTRIEI